LNKEQSHEEMNRYSGDAGELQSTTVGVDLGGTRFKIGWLGQDYELHAVQIHETRGHRHVDEVLADMVIGINDARANARAAGHSIVAVGVGVPAVIEPREGRILLAPNLSQSWQRFPLADALGQLVGLPVHVINDARSFTLAEARVGAARGVANVLGITVGTGVGGGLVLDGQVRFGPHCFAGEFGHITCDPHGPRCGCGGLGCVEAYASGTAIAAAALRPLLQGRAPRLRDILGGDNGAINAQAVAAAAVLGDAECLEIFTRAGEALGIAIANVMKIVDVERVVIGGGVAAAVGLLFDPIRAAIRLHTPVFNGCEPDLVTAQVAQAGAIGAAIWAQERFRSSAANTQEGA
jgi:glucokinase